MCKNKISVILIIFSLLICSFFFYDCSKPYDGPSFTITHYGRETWNSCVKLDAVLEDMKKFYKDKMTVNYIDLADENSSLDADKKYNIQGIPFVVLFNDKNEQVYTFVGYKDKKELTDILKKYGLIN